MKFLRHILFLLFVVMLMPSTMVAQNIGERQEPCDSSGAGWSLRQAGASEVDGDVLHSFLNIFGISKVARWLTQNQDIGDV